MLSRLAGNFYREKIMSTDTIADVLTRIRNAQKVYHKTVVIPLSRMAGDLLAVLKKEGYIESFDQEQDPTTNFENFKVYLKYDQEGEPLVSNIKRVSTPGRRVYARTKKLPRVLSGLGMSIISTSQGVMTDRDARRLGIGGEVIATVY